MIDKMNIKPMQDVHIDEVLRKARAKKLDVRPIKLRNEGMALRIGQGVYIFHNFESQMIYKIQSRPSAFTTYKDFDERVRYLFTDDVLEQGLCTRLDFAIDYNLDFREMRFGFDVDKKHFAIYTLCSHLSQVTQIVLGKDPEKFSIYDKTTQLRSRNIKPPSQHLSRIEVQLTKHKVPIRRYSELNALWIKISNNEYSPFRGVRFSQLKISECNPDANWKQIHCHGKLQASVQLLGISTAKRLLNMHGNFIRDYSKHLEISPFDLPPPQQILIQNLNKFFGASQTGVSYGASL